MVNFLKPYLSQFRSINYNMNVISDEHQLIQFKKGDDIQTFYCEDSYFVNKENKGKEQYINYDPKKYIGANLTHIIFTNISARQVIVLKYNEEKIAKVISKYKPQADEDGNLSGHVVPLKQFGNSYATWDIQGAKFIKDNGSDYPKFDPFKKQVFSLFKKQNKYTLYKGFNLNHTDVEPLFGVKQVKLNDVVNINMDNTTEWFDDRTTARKEIQYQGVLVKGLFFDRNLESHYNVKSGSYGVQVVFNNIIYY